MVFGGLGLKTTHRRFFGLGVKTQLEFGMDMEAACGIIVCEACVEAKQSDCQMHISQVGTFYP